MEEINNQADEWWLSNCFPYLSIIWDEINVGISVWVQGHDNNNPCFSFLQRQRDVNGTSITDDFLHVNAFQVPVVNTGFVYFLCVKCKCG